MNYKIKTISFLIILFSSCREDINRPEVTCPVFVLDESNKILGNNYVSNMESFKELYYLNKDAVRPLIITALKMDTISNDLLTKLDSMINYNSKFDIAQISQDYEATKDSIVQCYISSDLKNRDLGGGYKRSVKYQNDSLTYLKLIKWDILITKTQITNVLYANAAGGNDGQIIVK